MNYTEEYEASPNGCHITGVLVADDCITLFLDIGKVEIRHIQECCESVTLVDEPYLDMLIDSILLDIDISSENWTAEEGIAGYTFIRIKTTKGMTDCRFEGGSNGYYGIEATARFFVVEGVLFDNEVD